MKEVNVHLVQLPCHCVTFHKLACKLWERYIMWCWHCSHYRLHGCNVNFFTLHN